MIIGIATGIIGIIFACKWEWHIVIFLTWVREREREKCLWYVCEFVAQVNGFMSQSTSNSNVNGKSVSFEVIWLNGCWWYLFLVCWRKVHVRNEWWISFIHEFDFGKFRSKCVLKSGVFLFSVLVSWYNNCSMFNWWCQFIFNWSIVHSSKMTCVSIVGMEDKKKFCIIWIDNKNKMNDVCCYSIVLYYVWYALLFE